MKNHLAYGELSINTTIIIDNLNVEKYIFSLKLVILLTLQMNYFDISEDAFYFNFHLCRIKSRGKRHNFES